VRNRPTRAPSPGNASAGAAFTPALRGQDVYWPLSQKTLLLGTGDPCNCSNRSEVSQDQQETDKEPQKPWQRGRRNDIFHNLKVFQQSKNSAGRKSFWPEHPASASLQMSQQLAVGSGWAGFVPGRRARQPPEDTRGVKEMSQTPVGPGKAFTGVRRVPMSSPRLFLGC